MAINRAQSTFASSKSKSISMHKKGNDNVADFWIVGVNYKRTEASIRGQFAINNSQYESILSNARKYDVDHFFILSTCNRTEVYGLASSPSVLAELLCSETEGTIDDFQEISYTKNGQDAIQHLFAVSAGLDSQILGDYEILSQIKQSVKLSKSTGYIGSFLERLMNSVLQSSKAIKTNTSLSDGTVSVSFAAIQYIKEQVDNVKDKNILLVGTGKIGRNTCKNLIDYLHTKRITLINRTEEKAKALAKELKLRHAPVEDLQEQVLHADIILVASNATAPVITARSITTNDQKLIIDLSIPYNVDPEIGENSYIDLVNVDMLSKIKDKTLGKRIAEVPKAQDIIAKHIEEFMDWYRMRQHIPVLMEVKKIITNIHVQTIPNQNTTEIDQKVQKAISGLAVKMRTQQPHGCDCIETIHRSIA